MKEQFDPSGTRYYIVSRDEFHFWRSAAKVVYVMSSLAGIAAIILAIAWLVNRLPHTTTGKIIKVVSGIIGLGLMYLWFKGIRVVQEEIEEETAERIAKQYNLWDDD